MELIFGVILGLFILVVLVVLHELGHAIAARRNGVVVEEFGIGFPPRAWSKKLKNGILFTLNWVPLGGFVKLQGEHDAASKKGDYGRATFWQKTKILLAGVTINWLTAAALITILAWTGLPQIIPNQFTVAGDARIDAQPVELVTVSEDSPAQKAGLQKGDKLIKFAGKAVDQPGDLTAATKENKGKKVEIIYQRDTSERKTIATLRGDTAGGQGYLGVSSGQRSTIYATWSAPIVGVGTTAQLTVFTLSQLGQTIGNLFSGIVAQFSGDAQVKKAGSENIESASQNVAGPLGILGVIFPAAQQAGLTTVILLTASISLGLAIMNILPIPALDGGRWFTMVVFRLLRKPLTKEREESIQATGFLILMALIVVVTFSDVGKFFK